MLRLAVSGHDGFIVDAAEIERGGPSYSIDTVADLIPRYGIEGKPGLRHRGRPRAGFPVVEERGPARADRRPDRRQEDPGRAGAACRSLTGPSRTPFSRSPPRRSGGVISEGRTVRFLLPDSVLAYIRDNNLYG